MVNSFQPVNFDFFHPIFDLRQRKQTAYKNVNLPNSLGLPEKLCFIQGEILFRVGSGPPFPAGTRFIFLCLPLWESSIHTRALYFRIIAPDTHLPLCLRASKFGRFLIALLLLSRFSRVPLCATP